MKGSAIIDKSFIFEEEAQLTIKKTSLFFAGDGFYVYDSKGEVIFRVDSYGPDIRRRDEVVLMDASGKCLLTVRRKRPSLHHRWEGYLGERNEGAKPIFSVKRSSMIRRSSMNVEVYLNPGEEYEIDGSFGQRSCTIYDVSKNSPLSIGREIVGEIRRKVDASANVMLGKDVFSLSLKPGFDGAFVMGLILVLDQINSDDDNDFLVDEDVNNRKITSGSIDTTISSTILRRCNLRSTKICQLLEPSN